MAFSRRTRLIPRRSPLPAQGFGTSFHAPCPFARSRPGSGCVVMASDPFAGRPGSGGFPCPPNLSPTAGGGLSGVSVRIRMPSRPLPSPCVTDGRRLGGVPLGFSARPSPSSASLPRRRPAASCSWLAGALAVPRSDSHRCQGVDRLVRMVACWSPWGPLLAPACGGLAASGRLSFAPASYPRIAGALTGSWSSPWGAGLCGSPCSPAVLSPSSASLPRPRCLSPHRFS